MSTSWVLSIDETHPQHWDYAIGTGFWDLRTSRKIQAGDLVYFWQTKGSFVGRVRATSDVYPIDASTAQPGPWDDWPGTYEARFDFALLDAHALASPTWSEFASHIPRFIRPDWAPQFSFSAEQSLLASYFAPVTSVERAMLAILDPDNPLPDLDLDAYSRDERRVVEMLRAARDGQQSFRRSLDRVYHGCAISGVTIPLALEVAHIHPYRGPQTHEVRNWMLLRRDIHRVFEKHLITVLPTSDYQVRVSPALAGSEYARWDGSGLVDLPAKKIQRPAGRLLEIHNAACHAWLN